MNATDIRLVGDWVLIRDDDMQGEKELPSGIIAVRETGWAPDYRTGTVLSVSGKRRWPHIFDVKPGDRVIFDEQYTRIGDARDRTVGVKVTELWAVIE